MGTILLVDDDDDVLDLCRMILEDQGYLVLAANRPKRAMKLAEGHQGDIDLLIADIIMPEMSGGELAQKLKASRPNLKCIYFSNYPGNEKTHPGYLEEGASIICKPFLMFHFVTEVRKMLCGSRSTRSHGLEED